MIQTKRVCQSFRRKSFLQSVTCCSHYVHDRRKYNFILEFLSVIPPS